MLCNGFCYYISNEFKGSKSIYNTVIRLTLHLILLLQLLYFTYLILLCLRTYTLDKKNMDMKRIVQRVISRVNMKNPEIAIPQERAVVIFRNIILGELTETTAFYFLKIIIWEKIIL